MHMRKFCFERTEVRRYLGTASMNKKSLTRKKPPKSVATLVYFLEFLWVRLGFDIVKTVENRTLNCRF